MSIIPKEGRNTFRARFPVSMDVPDFDALRQKIIELGIIESLSRLESSDASDKLYVKVRKDLKLGKATLVDLAQKHSTTTEHISSIISTLIRKGYNIQQLNNKYYISESLPKSETFRVSVEKERIVRIGVLGDNHLASKYARLDVLNALYDLYEKEGITQVYNTGNWIDGEARFNKYDILAHGIDGQIEYFLNHYPKRKGIATYLITGDDHEGWYTQREGIDVGRYMHMLARHDEWQRDDLHYIGHMEADIHFKTKDGTCVMRVMHPGGGSAYALSYAPQKIVESFQGGEKPHILLIGHYHKASYDYIRDVHTLQSGTTQDQTPFMRKQKISAHLGGWIVEFSLDKTGAVSSFKSQWFPFFDRNFYDKKWAYKK